MTDSNFTLESVRTAFELETIGSIAQCEKILGILASMVDQKA